MAYDDKPLKKTGTDTAPQHWDEAANDYKVTGTTNNLPVTDQQALTKLSQLKTQLDEIQSGESKAQVLDTEAHTRLDTMETTLNSLETMLQDIVNGNSPATTTLTGSYTEYEVVTGVTVLAGASFTQNIDIFKELGVIGNLGVNVSVSNGSGVPITLETVMVPKSHTSTGYPSSAEQETVFTNSNAASDYPLSKSLSNKYPRLVLVFRNEGQSDINGLTINIWAFKGV